MTAFETLRLNRGEGVAVLTLHRPEVLNALNNQLRDELAAALDLLRRDDASRVVVLTGAGERAFSAGLDLREFAGEVATTDAVAMRRFRWSTPSPLANFDKPTIAAVNGLAIGGGVELALQCDIIVAAAHATFAFAEITRGIIPGNGGTQRLARRIGRAAALEMILTGTPVSADRAAALNLADHVVDPTGLLDTARSLARTIAANAPVAVRIARDAVDRGLNLTLEDGLRLEADLAAFVYTTQDAREGPLAFIEKRPPVWTGR